MKALKNILILAASLCAAVPTALQAVAVPDALLQTENPTGHETLYGSIIVIFVVGVLIGIWVQKRLNGESR